MTVRVEGITRVVRTRQDRYKGPELGLGSSGSCPRKVTGEPELERRDPVSWKSRQNVQQEGQNEQRSGWQRRQR